MAPQVGLRESGAIGLIAALAPGVAGALLWIPFGAIMGPQNGSMTRTIIVYATAIGVAVLIGIEAHRLGMGGPNDSRRTKPVTWAALTGLLFVVGFPVYMYVRTRYGERNLLLIAIVSMIAFFGSATTAAS